MVGAIVMAAVLAATQSAEETKVQGAMEPVATAPACSRWVSAALEDGPLSVGFTSADFATARHACPRTEVSLGGRFGAIIDTPNFYGALGIDGMASGSLAIGDRLELSATLEAAKYQWVQNAVLIGSSLAFGQTTVGATYVVFQDAGLTLAPTLQLMLPTSFVDRDVRTGGAQLGLAVEDVITPRFELHAFGGVDGTTGFSAALPYPRPGVALNVGVSYAFVDWFGLVLDVDAHFATRAPLDYLAPALGLRFQIANALGIQLAGTLPVAGGDRHDAIVALKVSYRF